MNSKYDHMSLSCLWQVVHLGYVYMWGTNMFLPVVSHVLGKSILRIIYSKNVIWVLDVFKKWFDSFWSICVLLSHYATYWSFRVALIWF